MNDNIYQGEDFDDKVRKQVEFYFSDSNLQTDRFLWKIYQANDGWVELKTILTFGRMRQYRPEEKVIEALKKSSKLVLSANNDMIKRSEPLKDFNELRNTRKRNSVHIEGFPKDLTQDDLEEFFSTKIAPSLPKEKQVCSVRCIKTKTTKEFFGVVDVEFNTQEDAEYFLNKIEVSYPDGIVPEGDDASKKDHLKKVSLLTFQEMKEGGKRFGVNEVTKRRSSFNGNKDGKKARKNSKSGKRKEEVAISEETKPAAEEETKKTEQVSTENRQSEEVSSEN